MGDVVVKSREDKKKRNEKLAYEKEKKERMHKMKTEMTTEMTPLNKDSDHHSYMAPHETEHETPYVKFMADMFHVGHVDQKGPTHEHTRDELPLDVRMAEHIFEEAEDHCLWSEMPDSIVALNLTMAVCKPLTSSNWNYIRCAAGFGLLPLLATFTIQFTSISCLWEDNSDLKDNEYFCSQHPLLQLSVVGIFMLTLLGPLGDIATEAAIGLSSRKVCYNAEDGSALFLHGADASAGPGRDFEDVEPEPLIIKEVGTSFLSRLVFWFAVAGEFAVWFLTLYVGVHYTLSQTDASEIVQSAVAISFINEIDNMVYDAVCTEPLKDFVSKAVYMIPLMSGAGKNTFKNTMVKLGLQTPFLLGVTYFIVYGLRGMHCVGSDMADSVVSSTHGSHHEKF